MVKMKLFIIFIICMKVHFSLGSNNVLGCGGFVKSKQEIDFSQVNIKLYSVNPKNQERGILKYETDCAPNNGYYFVPIYEKGDFLLTINAPLGWTFDPSEVQLHIDGSTDPCSLEKDINIQFIGFNLEGYVYSKNSDEGPAGVIVKLLYKNKTLIKMSQTVATGKFVFESLSPGEYHLETTHPKWKFENFETGVLINDKQEAVFSKKLIVKGYDVKGSVENEGEPFSGIAFVLASNASKIAEGCNHNLPQGFELKVQDTFVCYVSSDKKGIFNFPSVEPGQYSVYPFYKGETYKLDVHPKFAQINVLHDSVTIQEKFQVLGFEVQGLVFCRNQNKGIGNVDVFLDGKKVARSQEDGTFLLNNIRSIPYVITAISSEYEFDPITFKLSPNNPLKTIYPSKYKIRGEIDQHDLPSLMSGPRQVVIKSGDEVVARLTSSQDGKFECYLMPGQYTATIPMSDTERNMRVNFYPKEKPFIVDGPGANLLFSYLKSKVKGQVKCLAMCDHVQILLLPHNSEDLQIEVTVALDGSFVVDEVQPGEYDLTVIRDNWCWDRSSIYLIVEANSITEVAFTQRGYSLSLFSSHPTELECIHQDGHIKKLVTQNGSTKHCLPMEGQYLIRPLGCHVFSPSEVSWHTDNPASVTFTAVQHTVTGLVLTQDMTPDLRLQVETKGIEELLNSPSAPVFKEGFYHYTFSLKSEPRAELFLIPVYSSLLYKPDTKVKVQVNNECLHNAFTFVGQRGVFLNGKIKPSLEGVSVLAIKSDTNEILQEFLTNDTGSYSLGPFSPDISVKVEAHRLGYTLQLSNDGLFVAHKLSEVIIHVEDSETGKPLRDVLVTLSGGSDYRQNVLTGEDGSVAFVALNPGEYFFKPIMKEYKLVPSSKMITVIDGEDLHETVLGKRVAFSCIGKIVSLSGEPEKDIQMQAVAMNGCSSHSEDALSDENGYFRIRGLYPDCTYKIQMMESETNAHIDHSSPRFEMVEVTNEDIIGLDFIVVRKALFMDITVHVNTSEEFLASLRLKLLLEDNTVLYLHKFEHGPFIALPRISKDNREYIATLESSLSKKIYKYTDQEIIFSANATYKHLLFDFEPKPVNLEQELTQGSYLAVPITLLLVLMAVCHKQLLPLIMSLLTFSSAKILGENYQIGESLFSKRKIKAKRL